MALYPQTTCFYKAIIHKLPQTATEDYEVLFEDSSYTNGYAEPLPVAQRYVIAFKSTKKSGGGGGSASASNGGANGGGGGGASNTLSSNI